MSRIGFGIRMRPKNNNPSVENLKNNVFKIFKSKTLGISKTYI